MNRQITLFDEDELTGIDESAPDTIQEAWKKAKKDMKSNYHMEQLRLEL